MKRAVKVLCVAMVLNLIFVSCSQEPSLQRYFVEHQEQPNFIVQDLPVTMVEIDKTNFNETQNAAFNSVNRLNFLGYKIDDKHKAVYALEVEKIKSILKQEHYEDLMEFSDAGRKIIVKYVGDEEKADELIVFGSASDMGFAVLRILGDDMSPEKMITLTETINSSNLKSDQLKEVFNFFN